tara:strand:+ start:185 stop:379 length:195 start_codon:yes stop_codon:yes gene_type:complete
VKYTLPEDMTTKIRNVRIQIFISTLKYFIFDLGQAKKVELDNSTNSFVGCCSLGTGHFELFINI